MAKKVKKILTDDEKFEKVKQIKNKKRFKTKKALREFRVNNLKRYHYLKKELNGVWDSIPEDKRFKSKKDVLKELVVTYRDKNDYDYISNTFDVAVGTVLGYEFNEAEEQSELDFRQLAERDEISITFPYYMVSNIITNLYANKDVEFTGDMFGEPFQVVGSSVVVYDWFKGSTYYRWCREFYDKSPVAEFLLYDYDGFTAKYELVNTYYNADKHPMKSMLYEDFRSGRIKQEVKKEEKVATIEEKEVRKRDKEIELELAKERNREKELLLKEFELGLITKKQYEKERKKIK